MLPLCAGAGSIVCAFSGRLATGAWIRVAASDPACARWGRVVSPLNVRAATSWRSSSVAPLTRLRGNRSEAGERKGRPPRNGARNGAFGQGMEAPVSNNDPYKRRPQRPPAGDVDQSTWNKGVIVATILAALVVIGAIVWAATSAPYTANNPPPSSTGQSTKPPPKAK
jgi:hypothetical protein